MKPPRRVFVGTPNALQGRVSDTKEPPADVADRVAALERTVASLERRLAVGAAPVDAATSEINYALPRNTNAGIATAPTSAPASL